MRTCCLAGFVLSGLLTGSAFAGTVADTGFEVSDSYPNPLDPNNGLGGYYDLHDLDGADGRPFADPGDVLGWGTNTWAGLGHGVSTTYVERNQPGKLSFEGDQYAVMRPPSPSSDLYVRRKFNPGVFNTTMRAMVSFAIRVDTPLSTAPYFSGNNPAFMLEYKPDGNPDTGDKEVNIELEADGDLEAKRGGRRVHELAGLSAPRPLTTAFTISLGTPAAMAEAAGKRPQRLGQRSTGRQTRSRDLLPHQERHLHRPVQVSQHAQDHAAAGDESASLHRRQVGRRPGALHRLHHGAR